MSHRDYEAVADILRRSWGVEYPTSRLVGEFVALFARTNPRFDAARFVIACSGLEAKEEENEDR